VSAHASSVSRAPATGSIVAINHEDFARRMPARRAAVRRVKGRLRLASLLPAAAGIWRPEGSGRGRTAIWLP
jgi:hypothetical protein